MSFDKIKRRDFLKLMGWGGVGATVAGCDMPTTVTLEEGKETVTSYLTPEEYVIPGIAVWYASTCRQCPAGCGIHGRVREGRVLKLEGNPESPVNTGKLCQMGQAGLQNHYNPDRVRAPMARKDGKLVEITWDEAMDLVAQNLGGKVAWLSDTISGHQALLLDRFLEKAGGGRHFVHEVVNNRIGHQAWTEMLGGVEPRLRIDKARVIVSLGADLVGTSESPVNYSRQYAEFRSSPRGILVQAETKMSLTGANADLWLAVRPGTEAVLALAIANTLATKHKVGVDGLPASLRDLVLNRNINEDARVTGVSGQHIIRTAKWLSTHDNALVVAGAAADGQPHGRDVHVAAMIINVMLGSLGKTIEPAGRFPFPQLEPRRGGTKALVDLVEAIDAGKVDTLFVSGANPVYTASAALNIKEKLASVPFKVSLTMFPDETMALADLVLPLSSSLEEWATTVPLVQGDEGIIAIQQPLMEPLYPTTRSLGEILLGLLKKQGDDSVVDYDSYYAFIKDAISTFPAGMTADGSAVTWEQALQKGFVPVRLGRQSFSPKLAELSIDLPGEDAEYPYHLVPSPRLGLWDGRHANLPWLQEAPDQLSKVVWDSWAEIHPRTAKALGVETGDNLRITSAQGAIDAKVYVYKGIHPEAIAVPLGQGHEAYGRYAEKRGVNPLTILAIETEKGSGEIAQYATRVKAEKIDNKDTLVMMADGNDRQLGRKMVSTVTPDIFEMTEGEA